MNEVYNHNSNEFCSTTGGATLLTTTKAGYTEPLRLALNEKGNKKMMGDNNRTGILKIF